MQVLFNEYSVARDSSTVVFVVVPQYEAAILSHIFGKERVTKSEEGKAVEVDQQVEITRLFNKYGQALYELFGADYESRLEDMIAKCEIVPEVKAKRTAKAEAAAE